jgi:hypothetical protein
VAGYSLRVSKSVPSQRASRAIAWAFGGALVFHSGVLVVASGLYRGDVIPSAVGAVSVAEIEDDAVLVVGCGADAALLAAARMAMCAAPWRAVDAVDCLNQAQIGWGMEQQDCQVLPGQTDLALLTPEIAKKLKQLDPEQLLDKALSQPPPPPPPPIELALATPTPPAAAPAPPPPPARPEQIVETAPDNNKPPPDNARFLADKASSTDKQTVARGAVQEAMTAKPQAPELVAKDNPREASVKAPALDRAIGQNTKAPDAPGALSMRSVGSKSPAEQAQDAKTKGSTGGAAGPAGDGARGPRGDGAITPKQARAK